MILVFAPIAAALISVLFGLVTLIRAGNSHVSNKKILDAGKDVEKKVRSYISREFNVLAVSVVILFVILLYLLGWKISLTFLAGAVITIAVNLTNSILFARAYSRIVEDTRSNQINAANIIFTLSGASSLFAFGAALVASVITYVLSGDFVFLLSLTLGAILVEIISKLRFHGISDKNTEKIEINENDHTSGGLIGAVAGVSAAGVYFISNLYSGTENSVYLSFLILGLGAIAMLIGVLITRFRTDMKLGRLMLTFLIIPSVLILVGSYFAVSWLIYGEGLHATINLSVSALAGLIAAFMLYISGYFISQKYRLHGENYILISNVISIVLAIAAILGIYTLNGYAGVSVFALALSAFLIPMMSQSRMLSTSSNAEFVRAISGIEMETDKIKGAYDSTNVFRRSLADYPFYLAIIVNLLLFWVFIGRMGSSMLSANLSDPYLIAGIVLGGLAAYVLAMNLSGWVKQGIIVPIAILLALPALSGLLLGASMSFGAVIGYVVVALILAAINDRVSISVSSIGLILGATLFSSLIKMAPSLRLKLIIGIALVVLILVYVVMSRMTKKEAK